MKKIISVSFALSMFVWMLTMQASFSSCSKKVFLRDTCNTSKPIDSCNCNTAKTLSLQPHNNPYEVHFLKAIDGYEGTWADAPEFGAVAWTASGVPFVMRGTFKFDLSAIPANAEITSAKLTLYSNPTPMNGNQVDANYGAGDAMSIKRIVTPWDKTSKWDNQPSATDSNQVIIPQTNVGLLDLTDIDVTKMTQDMVKSNNYGYKIGLINEVYYNSRIFCSSKYADSTKHPKLVIQYK